MELWQLNLPGAVRTPCDAASDAHPALVGAGGVRALLVDANPLSQAGAALPADVPAPAIAMRSGEIEAEEGVELGAVDAARRTWGEEGRRRFESAWASLAEEAHERGVELWLHPRAGDVVGDVPGLRLVASGRFEVGGLLLEPAALLTPGMLPQAEDHFVRMLDAVETGGLVRATLVTDAAPGASGVVRARFGEGVIGEGALLGLVRRASDLGPVCVPAEDADRVASLLGV